MDISIITNNLPFYTLHVLLLAFVILSAVFVFLFSFKSVEEPPYNEKKPAGKKRKLKEKKSQNGHAVILTDASGKQNVKASPDRKKEVPKSPAKNPDKAKNDDVKKDKKSESNKRALKEKSQPKDKKQENAKNTPKEDKPVKLKEIKNKGKENIEVKDKKKILRLAVFPKEDAGGEWERAISRKERRNRKTLVEDSSENTEGVGKKVDEKKVKSNNDNSEDKKNKKESKGGNDKTKATSGTVNDPSQKSSKKDGKKDDGSMNSEKKNSEARQKYNAEPPENSSTVYDEFAEVFKEPSKKAIKKRVRKE